MRRSVIVATLRPRLGHSADQHRPGRLQVHEPGATTPQWTVGLPGRPARGGLLWEPGADRLFAVTRNQNGFLFPSITGPAAEPEPSESTSTPVKGHPAPTYAEA